MDRLVPELTQDLRDDLQNMETIELNILLRELFRRVEKNKPSRRKDVMTLIKPEITRLAKDKRMRAALDQ